MNFLPANRLKLYRNFKALEVTDYHGIARYYERYEQDIHLLDFEEYFDCLASYTQALYEIGDHGKHLVMSDFLLETIIIQNVECWGGEDLYAKTLLAKAASLYYLQEYARSAHILQEFIKIHPHSASLAEKRWEKCLLRQKPAWLMRLRAIAVGSLLFTALFIAVEILVVPLFFIDYQQEVQLAHNVLLFAGVSMLLFAETRHVWLCQQEIKRFVRQARQRKYGASS